jgi:ABC-2 type transport system ATP-binding protein
MIIETTGLRKSFEVRSRTAKQSVTAVDGIDLAVKENEIFGFLGPNGAGKSTTLRMLTTLLPPDGGTATVVGHDLSDEPGEVRRKVGYVAQQSTLGMNVTGREEILLQCRMQGMSKRDAQRATEKAIDAFEITEFADRRCRTYSGGQRRRVDIALGTAHVPDLLFLDEPSAGLDPQSRAHLWDEIRRLRDEGMTVFLTTHYLDEADALCDRISIVDHGRTVATGTPDELKREIAGEVITVDVGPAAPRAVEVLVANDWVRSAEVVGDDTPTVRLVVDRGDTAMPRVINELSSANLSAASIELHRVSLDDVFLSKTGRSLRD